MASQKFIRVVNLERFQHYKDRNPAWIKLHRELLTSRTWVTSDDASRVLAIACMLLAAATGNKIPLDPAYIRRVAYLNQDPDLSVLLAAQFVEIVDESGKASDVLADASNLNTKTRSEIETEKDTDTEKDAEKLFSSELCTSNPKEPKRSSKKLESQPLSDKALKLAQELHDAILHSKPDFHFTDSWMKSSSQTLDLMMTRDDRSFERISAVIAWVQEDEFWRCNILSADKLRQQFDRLEMKARLQLEGRVNYANGKPGIAEVVERECAIVRSRTH